MDITRRQVVETRNDCYASS